MEFKVMTRKIGGSIAVVLPKQTVEAENIKEAIEEMQSI
jgi:antitoxin component of MazEF toxin-antitoxin module